jgi:hypothetical protein
MQHVAERLMRFSAGPLLSNLCSGAIDIADVDQLDAIGMLLDGAEVVLCNPTAAYERDAQFSVDNRRGVMQHGSGITHQGIGQPAFDLQHGDFPVINVEGSNLKQFLQI